MTERKNKKIEIGDIVCRKGKFAGNGLGVVLEKHEGCVNENKESTLLRVSWSPGEWVGRHPGSIAWTSSDQVNPLKLK